MKILAVTVSLVTTPGIVVATTPHGVALDFPPSPDTAFANLKREALRLAGSGNRDDFKVVQRLFDALPELRSA